MIALSHVQRRTWAQEWKTRVEEREHRVWYVQCVWNIALFLSSLNSCFAHRDTGCASRILEIKRNREIALSSTRRFPNKVIRRKGTKHGVSIRYRDSLIDCAQIRMDKRSIWTFRARRQGMYCRNKKKRKRKKGKERIYKLELEW